MRRLPASADAVAPFRLRDALESVIRASAPIAQAKGLMLALELDAALPVAVLGNTTSLRRIVGRFVAHAIEHAERGGVRIEASPRTGAAVRVAVRDSDGHADARAAQALSTAATAGRNGGGLALTICRELAARMGGEVGVRSAPGAGNELWLELPLPPAVEADVRAPTVSEDDERRVLRGARVLIAEDDAVIMMITATLLERWGVQVGRAVDGAEVIEAAQAAELDSAPFHAVLMDLEMPRLNGYAAARELCRQLGARTPPIIALTAAATAHERDEALRAGMCEFLTKPIDHDRLRSVLARWVGGGRAG
ncbi:MAG TPA: response regulator [Burkholderiaceae bacterium]|nr:response regulator [Burkholderiaceae bacterium]